jgi:hypothetical protein
MDQIHLSPLVNQIQLALGHISNTNRFVYHAMGKMIFFELHNTFGDTHNARTLIPMNTRTQTLPLGASSKIVPADPQD